MRYHVLDGLRGVAAIAVVTAHTGTYFGRLSFGDSGLAVDLFFCLSGFVITAAYADRMAAMGIRRFMALRYIRLYPLYLVGTMIGLTAQLLHPDDSVSLATALPFSLLLLPTPAVLTASVFPLDFPGWSLVLELAVNCAWGLLRFELKTWLVAFLLVSSLSLMIAGAFLSRGHTFELGFQLDQLPFGMARAVFSFTIGIIVFRQLRGKQPTHTSSTLSMLMLAAIGLIFIPGFSGPTRVLYDLAVVTLAFPAIVYFAAQLSPGRQVTKLCIFLGTISYGVYAVHDPLSNVISACGFDAAKYAPWSGIGLITLVAALVYALDRYYDMPARRRLVGLLAKAG